MFVADSREALPSACAQPMAKYRYLPRIFRAWITVDQLAPAALEVGDWEGMQVAWERADDAITAMPTKANTAVNARRRLRRRVVCATAGRRTRRNERERDETSCVRARTHPGSRTRPSRSSTVRPPPAR